MQKHFFLQRAFFFWLFLFIYFSPQAQDSIGTRGGKVNNVATTENTIGETYAVIVGISTYPHMPALRYADKDAELFRNFLKSPAGRNIKADNIKLFLNEEATKANFILEYRKWLESKNLKPNDRLYFYFAGHGDATKEGEYYFLAYDCYPNNDVHNYEMGGAIDMAKVKNTVEIYTKKGIQVILIMDACRTNDLPGGKDGQTSFRAKVEEKKGEILLLSTGPNQVSNEGPEIGGGHGLFTYYLVDGLLGTADKPEADGNNNGLVSFVELGDYTKRKVRSIAERDYKKPQVPVFCCSENDLTTISKFDDQTYARWQTKKELGLISSDSNSVAFNKPVQVTRGINDLNPNDSLQIKVYNQFVAELKNVELTQDSSAEIFYTELENKWPDHSITSEAKYRLAATYLNFCQQKINLFLSGKGLIHIINLGKEINKGNADNADPSQSIDDEQINKLKTIVTAGYDVALKMMDKAFKLLNNDPELREPIKPKYNFIKTMAAYADKKNSLKDVLRDCRDLLVSDSVSPAGYLLMGWIYLDMDNDSSYYYFKKAAAIAPKWAYPQHGLGNYYFLNHKYDTARSYFNKAVEMDSLYATAYRNIGLSYYYISGLKYDRAIGMTGLDDNSLASAKKYFVKARDLDPCDPYANQYLGEVNQDFNYDDIAETKFLESIKCDAAFISGYQKLSALYTKKNDDERALEILEKCVKINPTIAEAYRNLGTFYLKTNSVLKDPLKAEENFKQAIKIDPFTYRNYFLLARMYLKLGDVQTSYKVYKESWDKIGDDKLLFNELGNLYLGNTDYDSAIHYFNRALELDSTIDYVYYNIGQVHKALKSVEDSSNYYYGKAAFYNPNRWQKLNQEIADNYFNKKDSIQAKKYYLNAIKVKLGKWYDRDIQRLVAILLAEKDFAEAENTIKQYLEPKFDSKIYTELKEKIMKADGYFEYKLGVLKLSKEAFLQLACKFAVPIIMQMIITND